MTVGDLNGTVESVSTTVENLSGSVERVDGSVDALGDTMPLLVSCMIELNRIHGLIAGYTAMTGGLGPNERPDPETQAIQLPDLPESCEQARNRAHLPVAGAFCFDVLNAAEAPCQRGD